MKKVLKWMGIASIIAAGIGAAVDEWNDQRQDADIENLKSAVWDLQHGSSEEEEEA